MKHRSNTKKFKSLLSGVGYGRYERAVADELFSLLATELSKDSSNKLLSRDIESSINFVSSSFDNFENKSAPSNTSFAFVVPTRIMRGSDKYGSEVFQFLPILKYTDSTTRQKMLMSMPPSIVGEYSKDSSGKQGRIIFAPVFGDMLKDFGQSPLGKLRLRRRVDQIMNDVGDFAHEALGADIIGLGAILPKVTGLGKRIRTKNLTTTTGHGGTVWLILETVKKILEDKLVDFDNKIGIVGAGGAIASATTELLLEEYPGAKIFVRDKRDDMNAAVEKRFAETHPGRVIIADSNMDVLRRARLIISAVTTPIAVDHEVDLSGKIIIDDSQPGSFSAKEVKEHGGKLVWVVGSDTKTKPTLARSKAFSFGEDGLLDSSDVWGCEAEVGVLSATGKYELAINKPVHAETIRLLTPLFKEQKIGVAKYQAYGERVDF